MAMRDNDYMGQLVKYIEKNMGKGRTYDELFFALKDQGYSKVAINKAFERYKKRKEESEKKAVKKEEPKEIEYIKEPEEKQGFFSWLKGIFGGK